MIIEIINVNYLDTWVEPERVQEGEEGEGGGEDGEDPAKPAHGDGGTPRIDCFFHASSPALFTTIDILHIRYVDTPKKWKCLIIYNYLPLNNNLSLM